MPWNLKILHFDTGERGGWGERSCGDLGGHNNSSIPSSIAGVGKIFLFFKLERLDGIMGCDHCKEI